MPRHFLNDTVDRLGWIAKTYEPVAAYETIRFALVTVGLDAWALALGLSYKDGPFSPWKATIEQFGDRPIVDGARTQYVDHDLVAAILASELGELLSRPHPADGIFPWYAAQLNKLAKAIRRAAQRKDARAVDAYLYSFATLREDLRGKGTAIYLWADQNRVDIGRVSAEEVLSALNTFEVDVGPIPQGDVIYRFADGWTVQELPPEALEAEGEAMQHCVGDYCEEVESGEARILSLRDPRGRPHVTMEYDPVGGQFKQVYGKQNVKPKAEYAARARQFIEEEFDAEPVGMILVAEDPRTLALRGADLSGKNMQHVKLAGADLSGADLSQSDLSYADLRGANLTRANMSGMYLTEANMIGADLAGADVQGSILFEANLAGANLAGADLTVANLQSARLLDANMTGAKLHRARLSNADLTGAKLYRARLSGADLSSASLTGADLSSADLSGANLYGAYVRDADLTDANLRDADTTGVIGL